MWVLFTTASAVNVKPRMHKVQGTGKNRAVSTSEIGTSFLSAGADATKVLSVQNLTQGKTHAVGLLETNMHQFQQAAVGLQLVGAQYMENAADQLSGSMQQQTATEDVVLQMTVPVVTIIGGGLLMAVGAKFCGLAMLFFGGQTGLNIYMKLVLSQAEISKELHMKGIPAAFLVTAIQQVVAFAFLALILGAVYFTPYRYTPKPLTSWSDVAKVFAFGSAFAANIGLNNFSLSYLPISTSVMIRSSTPLATYAVHSVISFMNKSKAESGGIEVVYMMLGVFGAALVAVAQSGGTSQEVGDVGNMMLGVFMSVLSVLACALNLVLASVLGSDMKLNPLDTIWYMAIPVALMLCPLASVPHPCSWPGLSTANDWQVVWKVMQLSPKMMLFTIFSGVLAAGYNFLMYFLVQTFSATHTAFAGNFNKAALIILSLLLGMEALPSGRWGTLMMFGVFVNVVSFTMYSSVKKGGPKGH